MRDLRYDLPLLLQFLAAVGVIVTYVYLMGGG